MEGATVRMCDKCEEKEATDECVECGYALFSEQRAALLCTGCVTAVHSVLGKFAATHRHTILLHRQVLTQLQDTVDSELKLFRQAVGACTAERVTPATSLRDKTVQSCDELCSGIRANMAVLHKLITDKEQELVTIAECVRDHKLRLLTDYTAHYTSSIETGSKVVGEIEQEMEAPPTDLTAFEELIASKVNELRKLTGALLSPHFPHGGLPLPSHPSCGFLVDTSMVSTAVGYLVALHAEEVAADQRLNVNTIGSINGKGVFWVRVVADEYSTQDIMLQNISMAMSMELSRSQATPIPSPHPGQTCCAPYSLDQRWYRARVESITRSGMARVYFLDYGSSEEIPTSNLYPLMEQFQVYPFQMIQCCLTEEEGYSFNLREVRWQFNDNTREKVLVATIVKALPGNLMGPLYLVHLHDETNPQVFDVGATVLSAAASKSTHAQTHSLKYRDYRYKDQAPAIQLITPATSSPSVLSSSEGKPEEMPSGVGVVAKENSQPALTSPPKATEAEGGCGPELGVQGSEASADSEKLVEDNSTEATEQKPEATCPEAAATVDETKPSQDEGVGLPVTGSSPKQTEMARVDADESDVPPTTAPPEAVHASQEATQPQPEATELQSEATPLQPEVTELQPEAAGLQSEATQMQPEATQLQSEAAELQSEASEAKPTTVEKPRAKVKPLKIEQANGSSVTEPEGEDPVGQPDVAAVAVEITDVMSSLPAAVTAGAELEVYVTSELEEEGTFWVQLSGDETFDQLFDRLQEDSTQSKELYTPVFFGEGDLCVAVFSEDEQWYRARIERTEKGEFFVRYIDFGNAEERRFEHLKALKSEFRQLPPQALLCSIASPEHQQFSQPERGKFYDVVPTEEAIVAKVLHIADSLVFVQLLLPVGGADPVDLTDEVYTADVTKIQSMDFVLDKQGKGREVRKGSFDIPQSAQDHVSDWAEHMEELASPFDDGFLTLSGLQSDSKATPTLPAVMEAVKPADVTNQERPFQRPATQETERPSQTSAQSRVKGESSQSSRTSGGSRTGHGPRLDVGVAKRTILSSLGGRGAKDGGARKDRRWETVNSRSPRSSSPRERASASPAPPHAPRASPGPTSTPRGRKSPEAEEGQVKLFVKYMPHQKTREQVCEMFGQYGTVHLLEYHSQHRDKLYLIMDEEGGKKVMANLNGVMLRGGPKPLAIQQYKSLSSPSSTPPWHSSSGSLDSVENYVRLFVKNVPQDMGEDTLKSVLAAHGKVYDVVPHPERRNIVFAYMSPEGATSAIDALHGKAIMKNSKPLIVEVSNEPGARWRTGGGGGRGRESSSRH